MDDKSIRKILISYLQATNNEIRIYQEKNIGGSICDVMAVTDHLTGYEIKSDLDNYQRLDSQITAYSKFFDENYIVISSKHLKSAVYKVPSSWGIICIRDNNVTTERIAQTNQMVRRRNQLSILWKLELKNILVKNDLPMFAQKDKNYIENQLLSRIDSDTLGKQIAYELLKRDYSIFNAEDYTIHSYSNVPEFEIVDALSEEDLTSYTLDQWINLYKKAQDMKTEKESIYNKKPVVRPPHEITYKDIEARPGAPWISKEIINEFVWRLINQKNNIVDYEPITGSWNIQYKNHNGSNAVCTVEFGIEKYNALWILEATLNLREIKLYTDGKYDERNTIAAIEKQKLLIEEFQRWLWDDEDRIWEVEEAYNNMFAAFEKKTYDGSKLKFPEMNKNFSLYDYQKDAVQKIVTTKNTLLAFDVGAGKTYIMIAAAMKMREMGISRKNMFVVPNNIVGQWEKIFSDLYPKAKLLTIDPKSYKPELRTKTLTQIRDGDYDGIIIAYSCFEMIPLSENYVLNQMSDRLNEINQAVHQVYGFSNTQLTKERDRIKSLTYQFIESMDSETSSITFDQLEINTLFLDEAHNYKNVPLHTKLRNLNGINTKGSKKCLDMQKKIQCVQEQNDGRGAVLATGTPLCNSISDAYAMQMYLQPEEMKERHLDVFDNWVKTFASPEQLCEIDVDTSKFRFIRRFAKFFNLPELSRMFSDVAIFHAINEDGLPDMNGYTDIIVKKNKPLSDYMQLLCKRTELIRNKVVDKAFDNMLKVSTDGRKAALDLNLVGETQQYNSKSKLYHCVNNVIDIYKKNDGCSQLIFCDYSTPKNESFNVYNKLKEMLLDKGIPDNEIAFIHSYQTEARKLKLFKEVNEGKIRILIGSTIKLGIGANVQTKLKAIHHLDVPWRPADMVQREGRILRRGNKNKEVYIYRYIAEGSFDSYSWQILETKQRFISQFLGGSTYQRTATDLEENVLTYAQVKAIALAQPLMKLKAEKENELRNLQIMLSKENEAEANLQQELAELKEKIEKHTKRLSFTTANNLLLSKYDEENFNIELKLFKNIFNKEFVFSNCEDTEIILFDFVIKQPIKQDEKKPYLIASRLGVDYMIPVSTSKSGNIIRLKNFFKNFSKQLKKEQETLDKMIARRKEIENHKCNSDYVRAIQKCKAEIEEIDNQIGLTDEEYYG